MGRGRRTPEKHSRDSTQGAYTMWANVGDRAARLNNACDNSPARTPWHLRRIYPGIDPDQATPQQWAEAEAAQVVVARDGVEGRRGEHQGAAAG